MNDEPLMDAVVEMLLFLELSDASVVNEDAAVSMMELISDILHRLGQAERKRLVDHFQVCADRESEPRRQILATLAESLGLLPD